MNERRFVNRSQPQTLYMAVILCYIDAVFNLLGGLPAAGPRRLRARGGRATASRTRRSGATRLAVARRSSQVVLLFALLRDRARSPTLGPLIDLIFDGALVALLVHPMSRDYQRIWFR